MLVLSHFSCVWLCSSVLGILQARILKWLPFPPPGHLPNPGTELTSPAPPAFAGGFFTTSTTCKDLEGTCLNTVKIIYYKPRHPTPVLLSGKSHGWRSLVGCRLWGRTESDATEVTWQQQHAYIYILLNWHVASLLADIALIVKTFNPHGTYIIYFRNVFSTFSIHNYHHKL